MMHLRFIFCVFLIHTVPFVYGQKKPVAKNMDTVKIVITNLKTINSAYPDYGPVISADAQMLVFTSRRPVTDKEIKKGKMSMENIYVSYYDEKKKKWGEAKRMEEPLNQAGRHNSVVALSGDGQKMLLYRDDESGNGDFFESHKEGVAWTVPTKLPEPVNSKDHESSASFSPDGKTIYFISNRKKGSVGGRDIWICKQNNDGSWGAATNAGSPLNTAEDQESIYMHPDGKTIYFSSKGHKSMGGYDLFRSVYENGKWSEPEPLTALNTIDDDVCFVLAENGQTGFFSSAKQGGLGDKDIYEVHFTPLKTKKKEAAPVVTVLKGTISDEGSKLPLAATIDIMDMETNKSVTALKTDAAKGTYQVTISPGKTYGLLVKSTGYLFANVTVEIPESNTNQEIIKDVMLKKLEVGKTIVLNNIFYDFDKATLRPESMEELENLVQLMNENAGMKIELSSHTDNKGTDDYNQKLSQSRAQSVVDYLISKGIAAGRLVAKGYGETMPVSTNDTDEGRQLNRRTEFKILSK